MSGLDRDLDARWLCVTSGLMLASAACTAPTFDERSEAGVHAAGDASDGAGSSFEDGVARGEHEADAGEARAGADAAVAPDAAPEDDSDAADVAPDADVASDAGTATDASSVDVDAMASPIPAWANPLLGIYAKRSVNFGYDDIVDVLTLSEELSLVTIAQDGDHLEMTTQLCSLRTEWQGGTPTIQVKNPLAVAPARSRIVLGMEPVFSSETVVDKIGFDPDRQKRCDGKAPLAQIESLSDQVWLSNGRCVCAENPGALPSTRDDCRLTDPDHDGAPGITLVAKALTVSNDGALIIHDSVKITEGHARADREHSLVEERSISVVCVNAELDGCSVGNNVLCSGSNVVLAPLAASATCSTVTHVGATQLPPLPPFPTVEECRAKSRR